MAIQSVGDIPKALQKFGVTKGFLPRTLNQSRLVIAGKPGVGKSTLASSNPKAFVIDLDRGTGTVADPQCLRYVAPVDVAMGDVAAKMTEVVDTLVGMRERGDTSIEMVVIDTIDAWIESLIYEMLAKNEGLEDPGDYKGGHGKGWGILRGVVGRTLDRLARCGYGWTVISHIAPKTIRTPAGDIVRYSLCCSDGFKNCLISKCEYLLFVEKGVVTEVGEATEVKLPGGKIGVRPGKKVQRKVRWLKTLPGGLWQGEDADEIKVRVPLPSQILIPSTGGWESVSQVYDAAVESLIAGNPVEEK